MNVTLSNEQNTDTKRIFIGSSLTIICIALAVAIGIIHFGRNRSKDNTTLFVILILLLNYGLSNKLRGC